MTALTEIESLLILCFFKFDKGKNTSAFLKQFNEYFGKELGEQTLLYELSIIESAEESYNMPLTNQRSFYRKLWLEYSAGTRLNDTKTFYQNFKNGKFYYKQEEKPEPVFTETDFIIDKPILPPSQIESQIQQQQRSNIVKLQALNIANHKCENNCNHTLFLKKNGCETYTEAHHLIPLRFQKEYLYSLDIPANIVSLCPSCHRQLHYGKDIYDMLKYLWTKRHLRLQQCGIEISLLDLFLMYR